MDLIGQIFIPFATAFLGAFAGWFFKRHRLQRENVQLDKANEAQDITNFGSAVDTWQKLVAALDEQIVKLLAQSKEDSTRISELTQEVYSLRQQVDQLQQQLARYQGDAPDKAQPRHPAPDHSSSRTAAGRGVFLLLLLFLLLPACHPIRIIGGAEQHAETRETVNRQTDSVFVYIGDSTLIREKGDTVFVTRCRTRYVDRWRERHDTVVSRDSIRLEVPVPVEKPLSAWVRLQVWAGRIALLAGVALLLAALLKHYLKSR